LADVIKQTQRMILPGKAQACPPFPWKARFADRRCDHCGLIWSWRLDGGAYPHQDNRLQPGALVRHWLPGIPGLEWYTLTLQEDYTSCGLGAWQETTFRI